MRELPIFHVDAFTAERFRGNPAAVVPLDGWLADSDLQAIAAENNLSETAFFVSADGGYELRWFTPTVEVRLCGHATLATAHVLFDEMGLDAERIEFATLSGRVAVSRNGGRLCLEFPRWTLEPVAAPPPELVAGLAAVAAEWHIVASRDNYFAVFADEDAVAALTPDFAQLARLHPAGVIVTAPGLESDCVCRYFAPSYGIDEDPGTGSIHCALAPFWSERLGIDVVHSRQLSARGADFFCRAGPDTTLIAGTAVTYLQGLIRID